MECFYVSSACNKNDYPDNHAGDFTNNFNRDIQFDDKWKLALSDVKYDLKRSWDNVRDGNNSVELEISNYPILTKLPCELKCPVIK